MSRHLRPIENDTPTKTWCGPAVVCSITGFPMSEVRERFIQNRRRKGDTLFWGRGWTERVRPVKGTTPGEIGEVLEYFGWDMIPGGENALQQPGTMSLARWLKARKNRNEINILNVRQHWIVVKGNKMADSFTGEPVNIGKCPHRRRKVWSVHKVVPNNPKRYRRLKKHD